MQDAYCGAMIEEIDDAPTAIVDGETMYFCSTRCRALYIEQHAAEQAARSERAPG